MTVVNPRLDQSSAGGFDDLYGLLRVQRGLKSKSSRNKAEVLAAVVEPELLSRRARRGHEAACSEKLLRLLSDRAQTLHNNRTFYSKQSYRVWFLILTVFGGKMTPQC